MDGCESESRKISKPTVSNGGESPEFGPQALALRESMSSEWTDEKHSLYLKSMEASFVNQLYNSMDILGLQSPEENPNSSQQTHYDISNSSGQFKVLQDGSWNKINFSRPEQAIKNESQEILTSPWIQHFKPARKSRAEIDASQCEATSLSETEIAFSDRATCSRHSYLCRCHSYRHHQVDSNTEVSDQNFVDEDIETAKKTSSCSSKRLKTRTIGDSSKDQAADDRR